MEYKGRTTLLHDFTMYNPWIMNKQEILIYIHRILNRYNLEAHGRFCGRDNENLSDYATFRLSGFLDNHDYDIEYIDCREVPTWDFESMRETTIQTYSKERDELLPHVEELINIAAKFDESVFTGIGGEIGYSFTARSIEWEVLKYVTQSAGTSFYHKA
jgi:hypothetical protein